MKYDKIRKKLYDWNKKVKDKKTYFFSRLPFYPTLNFRPLIFYFCKIKNQFILPPIPDK